MQKLAWHLGVWIGVFWLFGLFFSRFRLDEIALPYALALTVAMAMMFYVVYGFVFPRLFRKHPRWRFPAAVALSVAAVAALLYGALHVVAQWYLEPAERARFLRWEDFLYYRLPLVLLPALVALVWRLFESWKIMHDRVHEVRREKLKTELEFLKSQVNPHFLFNSLNAIYGHIDKTNTSAREILLQFSDLLRYQLYECAAERILIEKEVTYLQNYVHLQRLRKEASLDIDLRLEGNLEGASVAPLLLVPFLENAFKYVSNHEHGENQIFIHLARPDTGRLVFSVKNTTDRTHISELVPQGGIGIANVRRRLELLYPERHRLEISRSEEQFEVRLELDL